MKVEPEGARHTQEREVKLDISSHGEVGKAIHSEYAEPQSPTGRCAGFAALPSPGEVSRDSAMKPLPFLFKGVTRAAFSNGRGVAPRRTHDDGVSLRVRLKRVAPGAGHSWEKKELKEKLQQYVDEVNAHKPGFIEVVRHSRQEGLIRSRVSGWRAATAPVVTLFDAHVEFNVGWAEPVLTRIKENRKRVISPSFDSIKYDNFEIEEYPLSAQGFDWELWCRYLNPPKSWWKLENTTAPIRSPALIGCFIVDREYFQEIGLLDEGMEVYGGENVELGIRVWQCGGSVEVLPCSRIAHIERAHKPYTEDLTAHVRRNALRVAESEVWMDEFKSQVYMAWNIPQEDSGVDIGDISERKALRRKLQCKTFRWYLVSVYPEMRMYSDTIAYGVLQNSLKSDLCLDQGPDTENIPIMYICHGMTPQNVHYTSSQQLHVGVLSPTIGDDDNRCLVDVNSRPRLIECNYAKAKRMKLYWQFTQAE
ncbi:polypeptide N-acetylgalactosaminyltransferase 18-like [Molothrus aeneus]|uniref:polypeptide N-acetylgalactosaminyltransferase 18-like n=1 Tax=Molothrus aeneus TaxID=84833 RepID=UPI00345B0348